MNVGGTNPAFEAYSPELVRDSWLTIGDLAGANGVLSTIGIEWDEWTADAALATEDGAVFYMDPTTACPAACGPAPVLLAQLTVPDEVRFTVTFGLQGRVAGGGPDWHEQLAFALSGGGSGSSGGKQPPAGGGHR